jgi:polysaccharide chain length determinant protein (PEP-CTERM system associated)
MDKLIFEVLRHARAMCRYLWLGLFTAWGVALIGAVAVFVIPKKYEASARVFVNTDSILKPLMAGMTVQPETNQRVALLSKLIISRPNVEKLIRETGLDARITTTEQKEKLIDNVIRVLDIQGSGGRDNIYVLTFRDTEPERAKHMVELLVAKFIETSKHNDTDAAKRFLDEQAATYERKLQEAESRLKEFKLKNMAGLVTGESKDHVAQLATVGEQLEQARLQLREAENSRDAFRRGLAGEDVIAATSAGNATVSESVADLDARIDAMKRTLDGLLQKFTDSHPDVVGARRVIQELQEQRRTVAAEYGKAGIPVTRVAVNGPRASEQLKVSLAQAEASVASLRVRAAEYAGRYNSLREVVRRMPEYEAQLAQLNRDYETNKKNYENLVARRESVSIADDMQSVSGVADFRLIDPPRVSPSAVSPPRALMLLATLALALAAGAGIMFIAKEVRGRFYDRAQLQEIISLPVLGVVSIVVNDAMRLEGRRRSRRLAWTAGTLLCIYVAVVASAFVLTKPVA